MDVSVLKISVVMTVFNGRKYIKDAIDSVLGQTFQDFEFIIVDNASEDGTQDMIRSYKDARIVFIQNPKNLGQTKALNVGIKKSRGGYIARMDADDICEPDRLQVQYDFLEKNPDISLVGSWCLDIDEAGKPLRIYKSPTDSLELRCALAASGDLTSWCISHPTVMIRRNVFETIGYYQEEKGGEFAYPQDYEFWSRMVVNHYKMANIPQPLLKYRILEKSESREKKEELLRHRLVISKKKIRQVVPAFSELDIASVANMLECLPQTSKKEGETVFLLFDSYFEHYFDNVSDGIILNKMGGRLKLYYLPVLFKTNPWLAVREFIKVLWISPLGLFDGRFYRKTVRTILNAVLSGPTYQKSVRKKLFLR